MPIRLPIFAAFVPSLLVPRPCPAWQQQPDPVLHAIEKNGCTTASNVRICRYDFSVDGRNVEAISFQPPGDGPFPGALLIPGYQRTAKDQVPLGTLLGAAGFACVAVSQPGFGGSNGPADYVGPRTLTALKAGYEKLRKEPWVDSRRMAIYGYSRGAIAASLLALDLPDVKAAVFGAGAYDFQRLYDDAVLPGVRKNMKAETGMTPAAIRERSSILRMDQLKCPVLILHGEADQNVSVNQAILLRDRLIALHKEFEIKIFPGREHSLGPEVQTMTLDFFRRKLVTK